MRTIQFGREATALVLILSLLGAHNAAQAAVDAGRALAEEACSACHQVTPGQMRPPPVANPDEGSKVQAPAFAEVARLCLSESDLRTKITSPHYPMREQVLTDIDVGALAQYIRSLMPRSGCPIR